MTRRSSTARKADPPRGTPGALPSFMAAVPSPPTALPATAAKRDWSSPCETIETLCGRRVICTAVYPDLPPPEPGARPRAPTHHRYELWEPIVVAGGYGVVDDPARPRWGLARTRRPAQPLPDAERVEHELAEQRRAMDILRRVVPELRLRRPDGGPGGVGECLFESRGDMKLASDPRSCAELALRGRRADA